MSHATARALHEHLTRTLDAAKRLAELWENCGIDGDDVSRRTFFQDIGEDRARLTVVLEEAILYGIDVMHAFDVLAGLSCEAALAVLHERYLGHGDPDKTHHGYQTQLSSMLCDLVEHHGEAAIRQVLDSPRFAPTRLDDSRVMEAMLEALELDDVESFHSWRLGETPDPG